MMAGDKCYLSPETTRTLPLDMEISIILIRFVVLCHTKILAMFDIVQEWTISFQILPIMYRRLNTLSLPKVWMLVGKDLH